jgi:UDP-N-acetylmuramate: L-alanyl-gamma-D-glutamyl-meso-diaminopimelate ligase
MKPYDSYYLAKRNLLAGAEERRRRFGRVKPGMRIHVSAACGKAMASVACLLKEYGCVVTGSDSTFSPPMSDVLDAHGIEKLPPAAENVESIDLLVVGNANAYNSTEVAAAREKGLPMISGAEAVAHIFSRKRALVVAGTHGKTTTSGLLVHVFEAAGRHPAYLIGGAFQKTNESYSSGGAKSAFAIYEGDEYNCAFFDQAPKFLRYRAASAIITSLEHDHVDLYPTFEDYKQAFQFLIEDLPRGGNLVIHESAAALLDLSRCRARVTTYGSSPGATVRYKVKRVGESGTTFSLIKKGRSATVSVPLFGEYNVENAVAVYSLAALEGLATKEIAKGMRTFGGTRERQELLGFKKNGVPVVRDYAHHPTAVALTITALRKRYPGRRIVSVFEPRSASSLRKVFEDRYGESLKEGDVTILIKPPVKEGADTQALLNPEKVCEIIAAHRRVARAVATPEESLAALQELGSKKDVILFMSSGDLDGAPFKLINA